jgi:hypothetical protein
MSLERARRIRAEADRLNNQHQLGAACGAYHFACREYDRIATELLAEVREWECESCRYVYPGPPQEGVSSVICPRCSGNTMPKGMLERRRLQAIATAAVEALKDALHELRLMKRCHPETCDGIMDGRIARAKAALALAKGESKGGDGVG